MLVDLAIRAPNPTIKILVDAFIDIGREDESGAFTSVVSDDDSLSDTHAKVDWAVEEEGDYVIRARSFASGQSGAYALTVETKE